ncbi:hypothetical protein M409DRAFT_19763 [Zasmidium cellare ATCC 36951]|uniref:non-specific serine/threonine protein kinase n=1 Tax=Zasmidium cellare ATCC 36951 TaxID=1080233 RepID=A0A6A6CSA5_ZASCE|nr:uncharacterized protein M409DRAFT_19763 [Zasmidium cellare ATCC 36951]KAF2170157.1 hypothetical protein M409DRAFT_19763 [Zasmidium cellare ATCC 36951]
MPPRPRTVGAYIEHEQKYRGRSKNVETTLRREWAAKTPQQRNALAKRLTEAYNARTIVRAQEHIAQTARDRFNEGEPYQDYQTLDFRQRLSTAITAYQTLHAHHQTETQAWLNLALEQENQGQALRSTQSTNKLHDDAVARASTWNCSTEMSRMQARLDRPPLPEYPAGRQRMPEKWVSRGTKNARIRRKLLTESANGRVGLRPQNAGDGTWFAQRLMAGSLILARKENFFNSGTWFDARKFSGDVQDENERVPWEILTHEAVANVRGLEGVVRLYEHSRRRWIDNEARKYTMFLEWFPFGDLGDLIVGYRGNELRIPEPFIWYCAESLAKCVLAMEKGHIDHNRNGKENGWRGIVHRDMKPTNVFLSNPTTGYYPRYPRPAVGDFGFGIRTPPDDPLNPSWLRGNGTEGYRAPESYSWVDRDSGRAVDQNVQIRSATDVYGIGMILYCLVKQEPSPTQPLWLGNGETDTTLSFDDEDRLVYSHHLLEIVQVCLSFRPNKRPTPSELLDLVEFYTKDYDAYTPDGEVNPHTRGMADMFGDVDEEVQAVNRLDYGQDAYRIGLERGQLANEL